MADMTDHELIGYSSIHCETPRALFSATHINRMLALAGHPIGWPRQVEDGPGRFYSVHEEMHELCTLARSRMETNARTPIPDNVVPLRGQL